MYPYNVIVLNKKKEKKKENLTTVVEIPIPNWSTFLPADLSGGIAYDRMSSGNPGSFHLPTGMKQEGVKNFLLPKLFVFSLSVKDFTYHSLTTRITSHLGTRAERWEGKRM